jgi:hypothetical protein
MHALTQKHQHLIMGKQSAVIRSVRSVRILATIFCLIEGRQRGCGTWLARTEGITFWMVSKPYREYFSLARDLEAILPSTHAAHSVQSALSRLLQSVDYIKVCKQTAIAVDVGFRVGRH